MDHVAVGDDLTRALRRAMNNSDDDNSSDEYGDSSDGLRHALQLSGSQERVLQIFVLLACSVSFISICFIILHHLAARYGPCCAALFGCGHRRRRRQTAHPHAFAAATTVPTPSTTCASRDFNAELVFVLSWIDLISILSRMAGRTFLEDHTLCLAQAVTIHAAGLSSCLWTTCMSFNLYRWIVFGESDKKRRSRLGYFIFFSFAPSILLTLYPLQTDKYGNASFYCWIMDPTLMFVHFYVYYVVLAAVNIVLLLTIRSHLKQRAQWHDSGGADATSSSVIRRKALLYIVIFLLHRMPILGYRVLQSVGVQSFAVGVAVQFILNLDGFSNAVVYGGLFKKLPCGARRQAADSCAAHTATNSRPSGHSDHDNSVDQDEYVSTVKRLTGTLAMVREESCYQQHDAVTECATDSGVHTATATSSRPSLCDVRSFLCSSSSGSDMMMTSQRVSKKRRFAAGLLDRHSIELGSERDARQQQQQQPPPPPPAAAHGSFSIFTTTFNMGEQNVDERELVEWIPIGHEIYVIGVQECMNLGDLQAKVLAHLVAHTHQKYVHFSREIGKRATALGYHGYIALTVFVLEQAVLEGRFEMPRREAMSKHAQEVFRGKSLLLFGRASNKGAVGMSFRYGNTSFAFVTCHLASDSAGGAAKKLSFRGGGGGGGGGGAVDTNTSTGAATAATPAVTASPSSTAAAPASLKPPPSKMERRNQDAMEILQQLYLDEEDHGFGFPLLHHHSFVLGDLNYRMNRKGATPSRMLDLLARVGQACSSSSLRQNEMYLEVATPTTMRLVPDLPLALHALIREHDELTMLRESSKLFHGFDEPPITFFPTFRRIRGEVLQSFDGEALRKNYSLVASGGGLRVPSYTDRILHTSLAGRRHQVQCLYYDSCEAVTSSDHKPVCAVFRVAAVATDSSTATTAAAIVPRAVPRFGSLFATSAAPVLVRKNSVEAACDVTLKLDFRSIQWMDAVDGGVSSLFSRLENVELGCLFPLPCEDVLSHQRKLQEVAEHLNWGESIDMATPLPSTTSPGTATTASPNFHVLPWNSFVEHGLRYTTRVSRQGTKHVALLLRTRSRAIQRSASSARTRSTSGHDSSPSIFQSGRRGRLSSMSSTGSTAARSFTSSAGAFELSLGHGTFHIDRIGKRQDTVVPLTLGGNLVAQLRLRVTLTMVGKE